MSEQILEIFRSEELLYLINYGRGKRAKNTGVHLPRQSSTILGRSVALEKQLIPPDIDNVVGSPDYGT